MSDRDTIASALAPYDDDTVRGLVADIVERSGAGKSTVRSPFGLLVSRARQGLVPTADTRPDEPAPAPPRVGETPGGEEIDEVSVDDGVFDLLADYQQSGTGLELVRALDEAIADEFTPAALRLLSPTALRALRAETLRRHNNQPGGIVTSRIFAAGRDVSAPRPGTHRP